MKASKARSGNARYQVTCCITMNTQGVLFVAALFMAAVFVYLPEAHAERGSVSAWTMPDFSRVRETLMHRRTEMEERVAHERARIEERIEEIRKGVPVPDDDPEDDEDEDADDGQNDGTDGTDDTEDGDDSDDGADGGQDDGEDDGTDDTGGGEDPDDDTDSDTGGGTDEGDSEAPLVTFAVSEHAVLAGTQVTLTWSTERARACTASGANDWQGAVATSGSATVTVHATTTYMLACGNTVATTTRDVTVGVRQMEDSEQKPNDTMLITEVHFNPNTEAGQGNNTDNEWVELYNGTAHSVDLAGWSIRDNTLADVLATTTFVVPSGGYVVVTRAVSTDTYWEYGENAMVIHLNSALGNGLGNAGDSLSLYNAEGIAQDALSWGVGEAPVMDPPVSIVGMPAGASLERVSHSVDTDTAADWGHQPKPTPGE